MDEEVKSLTRMTLGSLFST